MKRKLLAMVLAVVMVLGLIPGIPGITDKSLGFVVSAYAAEYTDGNFRFRDVVIKANGEEWMDGESKQGTLSGVEISEYTGVEPGVTVNVPRTLGGKKVISIGRSAFGENSNDHIVKSVTIPDTVFVIRDKAFGSCRALENVNIPGSVKFLKDMAFADCINLKSVTFDAGSILDSIGVAVFIYCNKLESISLPDSVRSVGDRAFEYCTALAAIDLTHVSSLGNSVFNNCTSLKSASLSTELTRIPMQTFRCTALLGIDLPDSVTEIGQEAFMGCPDLKNITIPAAVTGIGAYAFNSYVMLEVNRISGLTDVFFEGNAPVRMVSGLTIFPTSTIIHYYSGKTGFGGTDDDCGGENLDGDAGRWYGCVTKLEVSNTNSVSWPAGSTLTASDIGSTMTTLTWTPAQASSGGAVSGYRVYQEGTLLASVSGTVETCKLKGLEPNKTYEFQVQAGDADNQWTTDGPKVSVTTIETKPKKLTANVRSIVLRPGGSTQLTLTADGYVIDNSKVTWSSDDLSVATVANGLVTATAKPGKTKIVATYLGKTVKLSFSSLPKKVTADYKKIGFKPGDTLQLHIYADFGDKIPVDVTADCTWTSKNDSVASVSASGVVTAVSKGKTSITAQYGNKKLTITFDGKVNKLLANAPSITLKKGEEAQIMLNAIYIDPTSTEDATAAAEWKSSKTDIVIVDQGKVTALSKTGKSVISAKYGGKTVKITVIVIE